MTGARSIWFSRKDIPAVVLIALLVVVYLLSDDKRDWLAIAIVLTFSSWLFWKFEQLYLTSPAEETSLLARLKHAVRRDRTANAAMAAYVSLYIVACLVLHQTIILAAVALTGFLLLAVLGTIDHIRGKAGGPAD